MLSISQLPFLSTGMRLEEMSKLRVLSSAALILLKDCKRIIRLMPFVKRSKNCNTTWQVALAFQVI